MFLARVFAAGGEEERLAVRREFGATDLEGAFGERGHFAGSGIREQQHGPAALHRPEDETPGVRQPSQQPRPPAPLDQRAADPRLLGLVVEVAEFGGLEVEQRNPAALVIHGERLHDRPPAVRAPFRPVDDRRPLFSVLDPADGEVFRRHGGIHDEEPGAPGREGFADLGPRVLLRRPPALVHELHELGPVRFRRVLPGTEHEIAAVGRQPQVHDPLALRDRNPLGRRRAAHPAQFLPALLAFLPLAHYGDQFGLLRLQPRLLFRVFLLRRNRFRHLADQPGGEVVLPQVAVFRRCRGQARGGEVEDASVRTHPERAERSRGGVHRAGSSLRVPNEQCPVPTPRGGGSVGGTNRVRSGNEPNLLRREFAQGPAFPVGGEPGVVLGQLSGRRGFVPAEVDLAPVGRPAEGPRRQPEDPGAAAEVVERQSEVRVGVFRRQGRLGAQLRGGRQDAAERNGGDQDRKHGEFRHRACFLGVSLSGQRTSRIRSFTGTNHSTPRSVTMASSSSGIRTFAPPNSSALV